MLLTVAIHVELASLGICLGASVQDTNIVLTDFAVASVIVEASLLAVLSYASIYALMRKRSSLSTGRFLWVFGISSAIFGVGYLLEPAVDYVLSPDESYGPVFFLEFYPGFAIAKGLIWATGGLLPGLLFTIALFFTRASASPLLAAIFATAALAATDLFSLVVCSLLCRSHEIASARDSIIFSLASDVVGGPIGGLIGFWFFRRVRDGNVTLAEESTRVLLGAFIGLVILCGAYILFAYPLPSRMALVISDHSAATLKRSARLRTHKR